MKICIISREYPSGNHVGGIGTYSYTAATLLAQNGHDVHVITYGKEKGRVQEDGVY
ncbi:MAG: glycosyltransferase family 4 protein, partial [bacterium]|nr:glycosyltransferase family 4 protein [bacterium]